MEVFKIRYKSTNCYFIDTGHGLLAFDCGWPGSYPTYKDQLKKEGYTIRDIKWLMVSHFHMDHAGLAGMLAGKGVQLVLFSHQLSAIAEMENLIERKGIDYTRIDPDHAIRMDPAGSRSWLQSIGIRGEVIVTDGHSEDGITLLLDSGEAFIGDLIPDENMAGEDDRASRDNWKVLRHKGARMIRPAHDREYDL